MESKRLNLTSWLSSALSIELFRSNSRIRLRHLSRKRLAAFESDGFRNLRAHCTGVGDSALKLSRPLLPASVNDTDLAGAVTFDEYA
jgi:hypothetical protein